MAGQIMLLSEAADDHLAGAREIFPAHHRKRYALMLNDACADLRRRGIDPAEMTALEVFSRRASERSKDRLMRRGEKMVRAHRAKARHRLARMKARQLFGQPPTRPAYPRSLEAGSAGNASSLANPT